MQSTPKDYFLKVLENSEAARTATASLKMYAKLRLSQREKRPFRLDWKCLAKHCGETMACQWWAMLKIILA